MKTNSKKYIENIQKYILNAISTEGYDTKLDGIAFFLDCFKKEYHTNNKKLSYQDKISDYLQGLPSCLNIDFYYCDIIERVKELHEDTNMNVTEKIYLNWFNHLAFHIVKLSQNV